MDRRAFVGAVAGSLVVRYSSVEAQPAAKVYRIGILTYATAEQYAPLLRELTEGLRGLGYVDGGNVVIEPHYGDGTLKSLSNLAADVVRSRADVIIAGSNPVTAAAKSATATIPIVMVATFDPVGAGLVASLARPGGNITGLTVDASPEMIAKNLGVLTEIIPGLSRVGILRQVDYGMGLEGAAKQLNVSLHFIDIGTLDELENAFSALSGKRVGAVMVIGPMFYIRRKEVAALAIKYRLPAMHALREYAQAGLFVTYGANLADLYRRAAGYVDRILKGAKPGNLPVEQPTKFDLVINLNTAKLLGVAIPQSVLLRADEVIR